MQSNGKKLTKKYLVANDMCYAYTFSNKLLHFHTPTYAQTDIQTKYFNDIIWCMDYNIYIISTVTRYIIRLYSHDSCEFLNLIMRFKLNIRIPHSETCVFEDTRESLAQIIDKNDRENSMVSFFLRFFTIYTVIRIFYKNIINFLHCIVCLYIYLA